MKSRLGQLLTREGYPKVDLMIRNHLHHFSETGISIGRLVISPGWQLQTSYGRKSSTFKMIPDIGGLKITVADRITVEPELYDLSPESK